MRVIDKEKADFLHCAAHDETVSRFGRKDSFFDGVEKTGNSNGKCGGSSLRSE
jgi:hypothetical protein